MSATGALIGLVLAAGLLLAVAMSPPMRRPTLQERIGVYLHRSPEWISAGPAAPVTPFPAVERIVGPLLGDAARRLDRIVGGTASVRRRLERLGDGRTVEEFRIQQLLWGCGGFLAGLAFAGLVATAGRSVGPVPALLLAGLGALGGVLWCDQHLGSLVKRREERLAAELPAIAELLALCVAAGDGPAAAVDRVAGRTDGELSRELAVSLAHARTGLGLVAALDDLARRTGVPAVARFADGLAIAVERGTPLADVLRAQAIDAREAGRRGLIEAGARREIQMMVPANIPQ